jgi:hypothetical protein
MRSLTCRLGWSTPPLRCFRSSTRLLLRRSSVLSLITRKYLPILLDFLFTCLYNPPLIINKYFVFFIQFSFSFPFPLTSWQIQELPKDHVARKSEDGTPRTVATVKRRNTVVGPNRFRAARRGGQGHGTYRHNFDEHLNKTRGFPVFATVIEANSIVYCVSFSFSPSLPPALYILHSLRYF